MDLTFHQCKDWLTVMRTQKETQKRRLLQDIEALETEIQVLDASIQTWEDLIKISEE